MPYYHIKNELSGLSIGTYKAADEGEALDRMAEERGYESYDDLLDSMPGARGDELEVERVLVNE